MINRYYPFGYRLQNGEAVLDDSEAQNVRKIFRAYLSGNSFKEIAQTLICAQVEYLPGKTDWNKNRVARILADSRYCGETGFPQIVALCDFEKAKAIRAGKLLNQSRQKSNPITSATAPILCGICGSQTIRRNDKRFRYQQKHICMNPDCKKEYMITDERFQAMIVSLLRCAKVVYNNRTCRSLETVRMENEIARQFDSADLDTNEIRTQLFKLAAEKYRLLTAGLEITDKLRTDLAQACLSSCNIRRTVMETVRQIILIDDDTIEIILINGQVLGKEQVNGTYGAQENCPRDPAQHPARAKKCIT